jgi:hypothetical protein
MWRRADWQMIIDVSKKRSSRRLDPDNEDVMLLWNVGSNLPVLTA